MSQQQNFVNVDLVSRLREAARKQAPVTSLVTMVRETIMDASSLTVMWYFMNAFGLTLDDVRMLEGARCMGNDLYSDHEIEAALQPLIQRTIAAE